MTEKFQKLIKELIALELPTDQYAIFGGGPLAVRGLRETNDIDLVASEKLFHQLKEKFGEIKNGVIAIGQVEVCSPEHSLFLDPKDVIARADLIEGLPFVSLADLKKWKLDFGRPKDLADAALIDNYLLTKN